MKKMIRIVIMLSLFSTLFLFNSCDELAQLALNIPLPIEFSAQGSNTTITETEYFCLSSYQEWRDNQEDIESAKYLAASYWTMEGTTANLQGNVSFSLYDEFGGLIFTYNLGQIIAANYATDPLVIELDETQITALDTYLSDLATQDKCFTGVLTVTNVTGDTNTSGDRILNGKVEIVLETDVAL